MTSVIVGAKYNEFVNCRKIHSPIFTRIDRLWRLNTAWRLGIIRVVSVDVVCDSSHCFDAALTLLDRLFLLSI